MTLQSQQRRSALSDPIERYRRVKEIRVVEDAIFDQFAAGKIHGTTHLAQGQEALAVGLASVTEPTDAVTATYRGHAIALALGMTPLSLIAEVMGKVGGAVGGIGGSMHLSERGIGLLPTFAIVGSGIPVAVGAGLAFQTRNDDQIAVAVFGDGSTNIGAFHEAMNLASIWRLPVLFVIDNNVYGEYSRWNVTTPIEHLFERANSYGMPAAQVDGMDIETVRTAASEAVTEVRRGNGPFLLEAKTYRFAGHSRADKAPYRLEGEMEMWLERDPVLVTRDALLRSTKASHQDLDTIDREVESSVYSAIAEAEAMPAPGHDAMFRNVLASHKSIGAQ